MGDSGGNDAVERGVEIETFSHASLSLEDLFVKVVQDGLGGPAGAPVAEGAGR